MAFLQCCITGEKGDVAGGGPQPEAGPEWGQALSRKLGKIVWKNFRALQIKCCQSRLPYRILITVTVSSFLDIT